MCPMQTIPLGPFEVSAPIGKGGMGEVWRGIHVEQQVPVAVKFVISEWMINPQAITRFRNEVRSVARLHHPGIVIVFDYGQVTEEAAELSGGRLRHHVPFLAMELVEGGCLADLKYPVPWAELKLILNSLLDALAHAHARGVIHRDLKPENVLLSANQSKQSIKLTDFGIAHALDEHTRTAGNRPTQGIGEAVMGTPDYMPPEQLHGDWRDYGPWTDLYALGCMAFELATGHVPFQAKNISCLVQAHLHAPRPPLDHPHDYPVGFENWLHRLMHIDPLQRFRRAADAMWSLSQLSLDTTSPVSLESLERTVEVGVHQSTELVAELPTFGALDLDSAKTAPSGERITLKADVAEAWGTRTRTMSDVVFAVEPTPAGEWEAHKPPPLPANWHRQEHFVSTSQLIGAGLGLYGLRPVPLIDREQERDQIWAALNHVHESGGNRLMLLTGPAGVGKSRLVEWVSQRAHEVGGAIVLKATQSPSPQPLQGLSGMMAQFMRCVGLSRKHAAERIESFLSQRGVVDEYEPAALTELCMPRSEKAVRDAAVRLENPRQRYVLVHRFLRVLSKDRPIIVWLDDIQWGTDALSFCEYLMKDETRSTCPVLLLLTARDEALAERPSESSQIDELMTLKGSYHMPISPLNPHNHSALVHELIGLDRPLAERVSERTAGNPLFAVQLVGDWVQRGVFIIGKEGFALRPGEQAQLPDDVHQVWAARTNRLVEDAAESVDQHSTVRCTLELAAVLGQDVAMAEWEAVCRQAGVVIPPALMETLLTSRLAHVRDQESWSFVHGMLRESLERGARESGRWRSHNETCARMLEKTTRHHSRHFERLGRHLVEAGRIEAAMEPLLVAARQWRKRSELRRAHSILDIRDAALGRLKADLDRVPFWSCESSLLRAEVFRLEKRYDLAAEFTEKAECLTSKHEWPRLESRALQHRAELARHAGKPALAARLYEEALAFFGRFEGGAQEANCLNGMGELARIQGDHEGASQLLALALQISQEIGNPFETGTALFNLGVIARMDENLAVAEQLLKQSLEVQRACGCQFGVGNCLNSLGEVARSNDRLDEAERRYRASLKMFESIGYATFTPCFNLGRVLLVRRKYAEAREVLERAGEEYEQYGDRIWSGLSCIALLPSAAALGEWDVWDQHYSEAIERLAETEFATADGAELAQLAGDLAEKAGESERARKAYELSLSQWETLGRQNEVAEVRRLLKARAD